MKTVLRPCRVEKTYKEIWLNYHKGTLIKTIIANGIRTIHKTVLLCYNNNNFLYSMILYTVLNAL